MNWDSLFKTINKKIKYAEEERDKYSNLNDLLSYNHYVGYICALYEMKELLRKRKSRENS